MNILVSACLLGMCCRYDGTGCLLSDLESLKNKHHLIPICPEIYGGLATPREPAEIVDGLVLTKSGKDVTAQYTKGAEQSLLLANMFDCHVAILKARSPSCGSGKIYDGSFSDRLIDGDGVTAQLLNDNRLTILNESNFKDFF